MSLGIWFCADTHFSHRRLAAIRGFESPDAMNEVLIERWNARVKRGDRVYHLGDVAIGPAGEALAILGRLNGQKYLIRGNHDHRDAVRKYLAAGAFVWCKDYENLKVRDGDERRAIILNHYAYRVWDLSHYGSWHLYGHSHGSLADDPDSRSCDVGVDCWGFAPVSYEEIKAKMATRNFVPIDHHGRSDGDPGGGT